MPGANTSTIDSIAWLAVYHRVEHISSNLADIEVHGLKCERSDQLYLSAPLALLKAVLSKIDIRKHNNAGYGTTAPIY
jgi:hypothetical protein